MLKHYHKLDKKFSVNKYYHHLLEQSKLILPLTIDMAETLSNIRKNSGKIIFEGVQDLPLDIDRRFFHSVTSFNTFPNSISSGSGFGPCNLDIMIGVAKVYTTKVGNGLYPTELLNDTGRYLRVKGGEIEATTGRQCRTGWLDLVLLKRSIITLGITSLALTKIDVLDKLKLIKICIGYRFHNKVIKQSLYCKHNYCHFIPIYHILPGWQSKTYGARTYSALPRNAKKYITFIEKQLKIPISLISTGPNRKQIIDLKLFL